MLNKVESRKSKVESEEPRAKSQESRGFVFLLASFFFSLTANAQCALCRAALESEGNESKAQGVNDGIVYLMVIPYILAAAVGYYIYRMNRKKKE